MEELFYKVDSFMWRKFPLALPKDHLQKLINEAEEAKAKPEDAEEFADCLICLLGAMAKQGHFPHDIERIASQKLDKLESVEWIAMPDGTYQSVK